MDTQALEARLREANKLEALARFARGVAHDFNNIFTAVTANCDLLLEDITPDDPRRPEVVAIRDAVERATDLTRRLFKLGAVQALESELVDLNDLVRATEQELTALAGDRIGVATSLEPRFSPLTADPRELKQILLNLVLNARDAMPDGGQITIITPSWRSRTRGPGWTPRRGRICSSRISRREIAAPAAGSASPPCTAW